jgi:tetratricopeptide (TPR) repeat protein
LADELGQVVNKCLDKDPARRYQRASDVRLVLEATAARLRGRDVSLDTPVPTGASFPPSPLLNSLLGASDFVGRQSELAQIEQAWARATGGVRQLVLLAGEPGIGKTRLSMEFARGRAEAKAAVLVGRCDEEALVPYQPFVEALSWYARVCPEHDLREQLAALGGAAELGPLVPELLRRVPDLPTPPIMNPEGQRYRLFEAVSELLALATRARPLVLVLEDLHWADKPTLLLLRHLVRASSPAALCIIATYREGELARGHPLPQILADLSRETVVTRLLLRGLDDAHIRGLIDTFMGRDAPPELARVVIDSTDGNPFFVGEVLRHLTETGGVVPRSGAGGVKSAFIGLPEKVKEIIVRRLSRLSEASKKTLGLAAVIGREFDVKVLEEVGDLPENDLLDALDAGVQAQLIAEVPNRAGRFTFVHALIRETLYEDLTRARRARLHRRVGEAIERLSQQRPDPPLADLAYHFVQAASPDTVDKAIDYATRAGDRAADTLAHEEAARLYEAALQSVELRAAGPETEIRRIDLHTRRARAFGALGQWLSQKTEIERALHLLGPDEVARRCELLLELANALVWLNSLQDGDQILSEALRLAERLERPDLASTALGWLAVRQQLDGNLQDAMETHRRAFSRHGTAATVSYSFGPQVLYLLGRTDEALALATKAAQIGRSSHDTTFVIWSLTHLGLTLASAGRYSEAARAFDDAREFGRKYGVLPFLARAISMSAGFRLSVFDLEGAAALQSEARELALSAGFQPTFISACIDLLLIAARRHDTGGVEKLLRDTAAAAADMSGFHGWLWQLRLSQVRAEIALSRGTLETAATEASEGIAQCRLRVRPKYEVLGLITRARAWHGLGRVRDAIADAREAAAVARRMADPALLLLALDAILTLDGDNEMSDEAKGLEVRISSALPDDAVRRCFTESEVARRVRRV